MVLSEDGGTRAHVFHRSTLQPQSTLPIVSSQEYFAESHFVVSVSRCCLNATASALVRPVTHARTIEPAKSIVLETDGSISVHDAEQWLDDEIMSGRCVCPAGNSLWKPCTFLSGHLAVEERSLRGNELLKQFCFGRYDRWTGSKYMRPFGVIHLKHRKEVLISFRTRGRQEGLAGTVIALYAHDSEV